MKNNINNSYVKFWGVRGSNPTPDKDKMYYGGDMDIDNVEYRWVNDRIEYYEAEERLLNKQEMQIANLYWKKYKKT